MTYHGALTAWFGWLLLMGHRADNPMVRVGRPKRVRSEPRPITDENLRRILRTRMNRRTRAMVLLAAMQGLRVHEIAKVRGEHLDLIDRTMVVVGKGGHRSTLPIHHMVAEIGVRMPRSGWWFPGADGGHQLRESVGGTIKEVMMRAGVPGSAHQIRHWFGTALVRAGVDLRTVQELMRHRNLTSTAIYTQIADVQRADGIQRLDPFGVYALKLPSAVTADELRRKAKELLEAATRLETSA
jgi:site-specific recombinase XerD